MSDEGETTESTVTVASMSGYGGKTSVEQDVVSATDTLARQDLKEFAKEQGGARAPIEGHQANPDDQSVEVGSIVPDEPTETVNPVAIYGELAIAEGDEAVREVMSRYDLDEFAFHPLMDRAEYLQTIKDQINKNIKKSNIGPHSAAGESGEAPGDPTEAYLSEMQKIMSQPMSRASAKRLAELQSTLPRAKGPAGGAI